MALLKVNESAQVLFLKPSANGLYPWVVLCYEPNMGIDKWIVWLADDYGNTVVGDYFSTLEEAQADFDARPSDAPRISN